MALTNAERQERYRVRARARAQNCVTPDDVLRAVELNYAAYCKENDLKLDFAAWLESVQAPHRHSLWAVFVPQSADPDAYPESLSSEDRAFLAKVGAVYELLAKPPPRSEAT